MLITAQELEVRRVDAHPHPRDLHLEGDIDCFLQLPVSKVRSSSLFISTLACSPETLLSIAQKGFCNPLTELLIQGSAAYPDAQWCVTVCGKEGVTDSLADTAETCASDILQRKLEEHEQIHSGQRYYIWGDLEPDEVRRIAKELLANELIEDVQITAIGSPVSYIPLDLDADALITLSRHRHLALNLEEMQAIQAYYNKPETAAIRAEFGLAAQATDVEIEALAQTWSEHCKHKIFAAKIRYKADGKIRTIDSLFQQYIKRATEEIATERDWLVSVFTDNAGIIRFSRDHNLVFKVETHNSPSALDPYGGALTGILGVNRDAMGTGIGARLLANTDVFCFAPPNYSKNLPPRLLHPRRIFEGVRKGVEHGGNKSGVPTVNGSLVFDERFLGKPLVYCGTVGIIPRLINGIPTEEKSIHPGDLIVAAGGRTGKDGIHGATFSSEELNESSPLSAVQIGDPFTQKKVHDFLLEARDQGLYRTLTDNGAGGFSSSIGELAELSGGCTIYLDRAPLKYPGLKPWEILLSESQERMTLAVPAENWPALERLADSHEVELASLGTFSDSGYLHAVYEERSVALLSMEFLHNGVPQLELEAEWQAPPEKAAVIPPISQACNLLHRLLKRPNICSKESVIRQYDHEVQGGTVVKPLCGESCDGPSNAAVVWPIECMQDAENNREGVVIGHGICPRFSDLDAYHMGQLALDEAVRNCVATGADPDHLAILDNFCWPDPIYHPEKTPDGKYKLAQLVRCCEAIYDSAIIMGTPFISGKDSMKNDYRIADSKISIPPTLLVSAMGRIPDVRQSVTMDFKEPGDLIYLVGETRNELGGSELLEELDAHGSGSCPKVDARRARKIYTQIHRAMRQELIRSCHDLSDGGLGVALAESAFAGNIGAAVSLDPVPKDTDLDPISCLFSESASRLLVSIAPDKQQEFEELLTSLPCAQIGICCAEPRLSIQGVLSTDLKALKDSWQETLL